MANEVESATLESMQKHFRRVRHYIFAYLEGIPGGSELEELVKKYKMKVNHVAAFLNYNRTARIFCMLNNYSKYLWKWNFFC